MGVLQIRRIIGYIIKDLNYINSLVKKHAESKP